MARRTHEKTPHAKMLLVALRSVGYTNETAIADILDNSISGAATEIELYFDWDNRRIIIADNGFGMDYQELMDAMEIGSADPNEMRPSEDLGRFGLGMKTASFSMAKKLLVISKKNSTISNAEWNLNTVASEDKWEISEYDESEISMILESVDTYTQYNNWKQGTLIIISELDRLIDETNIEKSKKNFYKMIRNIKSHIAITFHRFMEEDALKISVNGNKLEAWNPFWIKSPATMELAREELFDGKNEVVVEPYILPHKSKYNSEEEFKEAAGVKDWRGHQGFYVYRNRRLLVYGTWFGKFKKEPAYNLARIKLDMSADSDFEWDIDIKKSKATLPVAIEEQITQIAYLAIEKSVAVYNSRGVYNRKNTSNNTSLKYVWEQRKNISGNYMFYLNKKHPMLLKILSGMDENAQKELKTYLSLVESYSPTMLSGVMDKETDFVVSDEDKKREILNIQEKIRIYRMLQYDDVEIYDTLYDSPEYLYLREDLKKIIEETE
ncbi:MAG: ATP-binding protein [Lachnospira sp.]